MADPKDPKTEPERTNMPPRQENSPPSAGTGAQEPVRINLPTRPPVRPAPPAAPPPPPPAATPPAPASELKKETARVGAPSTPVQMKKTQRVEDMPEPSAQSSTPVQMKKTQPLVTMPEVTPPPSVPLTVTSEPAPAVEPIPGPLCWAVLGVSALILIVQIWNYFS